MQHHSVQFCATAQCTWFCAESHEPVTEQADRRYPFARHNPTGRIVTVSEVTRGAACDCSCLGCSGPFVAAQGEHRQYFRHTAKPCDHAGESDLHLRAKQIIDESRYIWIPPVIVLRNGAEATLVKERRIDIIDLATEHHAARRLRAIFPDTRLRPDIWATVIDQLAQKTHILIEPFLTAKCSDKKITELQNQNTLAFEINLSEFVGDPLSTRFNDHVLKTGRRYWVSYPQYNTINEPVWRTDVPQCDDEERLLWEWRKACADLGHYVPPRPNR